MEEESSERNNGSIRAGKYQTQTNNNSSSLQQPYGRYQTIPPIVLILTALYLLLCLFMFGITALLILDFFTGAQMLILLPTCMIGFVVVMVYLLTHKQEVGEIQDITTKHTMRFLRNLKHKYDARVEKVRRRKEGYE